MFTSLRHFKIVIKLACFLVFSRSKTVEIEGMKIHGSAKKIIAIRVLDNVLWFDDYFKHITLRSDAVIVDVGSNIGTSTVYFKKMWPSARIYAFDPVETVNVYFEKNVKLNGLRDVKLLRYGLSTRDERATIYIEPSRLNMNSFNPIAQGMIKKQVRVVRASHALQRLHINDIDLLKIDIEGHEKNVILDLLDAGYLQKTRYMLLEVREDNKFLIEKLAKQFTILSSYAEYNPYDRLVYYNLFLASKHQVMNGQV